MHLDKLSEQRYLIGEKATAPPDVLWAMRISFGK